MKKSKKVFIVVLIIIIAILAWRLSLFIRARILEEKIANNLKREYYQKTSYEDDNNHKTEEWYGDDYSKIRFTAYNAETGVTSSYDTWYDNVNKISIIKQDDEQIYMHYFREGEDLIFFNYYLEGDVNTLTHWYFKDLKYSLTNGNILNALKQIFVALFTVVDGITTEIIDGKECYAVKEMYGFDSAVIYYIEKDTNLIIRLESYSRYGETTIKNYEYSFEPITKETLDFPNLEEYYVIVE